MLAFWDRVRATERKKSYLFTSQQNRVIDHLVIVWQRPPLFSSIPNTFLSRYTSAKRQSLFFFFNFLNLFFCLETGYIVALSYMWDSNCGRSQSMNSFNCVEGSHSRHCRWCWTGAARQRQQSGKTSKKDEEANKRMASWLIDRSRVTILFFTSLTIFILFFCVYVSSPKRRKSNVNDWYIGCIESKSHVLLDWSEHWIIDDRRTWGSKWSVGLVSP